VVIRAVHFKVGDNHILKLFCNKW